MTERWPIRSAMTDQVGHDERSAMTVSLKGGVFEKICYIAEDMALIRQFYGNKAGCIYQDTVS